MNHLLAVLRFITILPVGRKVAFEPTQMVVYFPIAGLIVGLLLALCDSLFSALWPPGAVAVLDVVFLALLTGAFHLDGLGDSADGLFSHRPRDQALAIMKDSRVGAMGLVAVVCVLAIKGAGIAALDVHRSLTLVLVPAYARAGMLLGIKFLSYGRPQGGTGHDFFDRPLAGRDFSAVVLVVFLSLFMGWRALWLNMAFMVWVTLLLWFYHKRMGCITGDLLGAMTETTEALLFLVMAAGGSL